MVNFFKNKSAEPVKYERVSNLALNNLVLVGWFANV